MVLNERGVAATLSFGGRPFRCVLPWSAIWGIQSPTDGGVHVYPANLPTKLGGPPRNLAAAEPPPVEPVRPRLTALPELERTRTPPESKHARTPEPTPTPAEPEPTRTPAEPEPTLAHPERSRGTS